MVKKPATRKRGSMKRRKGGMLPGYGSYNPSGQGGILNSLTNMGTDLRNRMPSFVRHHSGHHSGHVPGYGGSKRRTKRRRGKAKKSKKRGKGKSRRRRH